MTRIGTNVQSLIAQRVLGQNNQALGVSLERLSTGLRINRGKDDPAGLIASENLRSEIKALNQGINNANRADQVVNIAEGGLQEISGLLSELQGLVTATASSAGLSEEEKSANQAQIDSILQTIDRVSNATNFQGVKLLNGAFDYQVSGIAAGVTDYKVHGAKFAGSTLDVDVRVTASAQQGGLFLSMGSANLAINATSSLILDVAGAKGARQLSFSNGTALTAIRDAINSFSDVTGVEAAVSGTGIRLTSVEWGASNFVNVKVVDDAGLATGTSGIHQLQSANFLAAVTGTQVEFNAAPTSGVADFGQNIAGTINGIAGTGRGKSLRVNSDFLNAEVTLNDTTSRTIGAVGTHTFTISGGGADFVLASKVDIGGRVSLGVQDVAARRLGNATVGYLDSLANGKANNVVDGDVDSAQSIIAEAIKQVASMRGRLGAFQQNVVSPSIRNLGVAVENITAAESSIRDADFAAETASLTRSQILVQAASNALALANALPQSALQLLG